LPNLVWLPAEVAKLTDYEGGPFQRAAQDLSVALYRNAPVNLAVSAVAEEAWALIGAPDAVDPDIQSRVRQADGVNWFATTSAFFRTRRTRVDQIARALEALERGDRLHAKVVSSRYTAGLPSVDPAARAELLAWLERFREPGDA
jgi:hypothetical protein